MKTSIPQSKQTEILSNLAKANQVFQNIYPGEGYARQAVHTVYGGADRFRFNTAQKMGEAALQSLEDYAPNPRIFGQAMGLNVHQDLEAQIYQKVLHKLQHEPVEDFRIDFEDGFGNRSWEEEDATALSAALEVAKGMEAGSLPPFIGIRIKPFTEDLKERGLRTLDLFLTQLSEKTHGQLPANFVVMLPKVSIPEQVQALVRLFELIESNSAITPGSLKCEMMVETTQAVLDASGRNPLREFVLAAEGRMVATAFGTYDYTASNSITAHYQDMGHGVCDFAHYMMKVALGATGIRLSDGATNIMPIGPHRGDSLSPQQIVENTQVVHRSWQKAYQHSRHSLWKGLYQGWDLHPSQLPARYAAVYTFFLESYEEACHRLKSFVEQAARATLTGDVFDDAATGQGLLNFFLRGLNCGALSEGDLKATGLSLAEIRSRSFLKILEGRRKEA